MSNRIRILFHCDLDGRVARTGTRALKFMEHLVRHPTAATSEEWIRHGEWVKRGKPKFSLRDFRPDPHTGKGYYIYLVAGASTLPSAPEVPRLGSPIERAQWLWKHLPAKVRRRSRLIVTRESRSSCWRKSLANPIRHGWFQGRKSKSKAPAPTAGQPTWDWNDISLSEASPYGHVLHVETIEPSDGSPMQPGQAPPLKGPPSPVTPAMPSELGEVKQHVKAHVKQLVKDQGWPYKPSLDDELPPLKKKNPAIQQTQKAPLKAPPNPGAKPEKPRLRIGVWA